MTELAIPDNVKEVLDRLSVADQVVLRSYIAGMRDQLREYKAKAEHGEHAHYHGDKLCTSDHGHNHSHGDADMACTDKDCGSGHERKHEHSHHHDHKEGSHDHDHKHHSSGHDHDHDHKNEEDIPAWKKRALESGGDATTAPFGGSWNAESSLDATK